MKSWYQSSLHGLKEMQKNDGMLRKAVFDGMEQAPVLEDFLNELYHLETVPVEYLICDEAFLPPQSLRFFYIDENWVDCMLDGALSLGRNCSFDLSHDVFLHKETRRRLRERNNGQKAAGEQENVRTGFLLRSDLVRGWPGLSIACYTMNSGEKERLNCQNISRIGEDIIFCIADGIIQQLELTEPKEGLSFGFTRDEQGEIPAPFREQTAPGVVDIGKFCDSIEKEDANVSALDLAVNLLQTPVRYSVKGGLL
jgi:hypothetical protein